MTAISTQLAHGIKATTTTTGTGSVTLAALPSFTLPLSRFSVGSLMSYSIQDGNNREWGIGTVQSGDILDRTTITGTIVAGTYTSGGSALTLSGGQSLVECTEHEGTVLGQAGGLDPAYLKTVNGNTVLAGADGTPIPLGGGGGGTSTVMYNSGTQAIATGSTPTQILLPSLFLEENTAGTGDIATSEFIKPAGVNYARFQASVRWNHGANNTATQTKIMIEGFDGSIWSQLPGVGDIQDHASGTSISTTQELSTFKIDLNDVSYASYTKFRFSATVTCTGSLSTQVNASPFFVVCEALFQ